jgi:hypothetical protein
MTVLKMLLHIYGSRASNGVIITTKGRKTVDYNFQYGSGTSKTVDVFDAAAFRNYVQKNALQMYQN